MRALHPTTSDVREARVLQTFLRPLKPNQAEFLRWIGMTDDPAARQERTGAFVDALKQAPLGD